MPIPLEVTQGAQAVAGRATNQFGISFLDFWIVGPPTTSINHVNPLASWKASSTLVTALGRRVASAIISSLFVGVSISRSL